ncbi:hypothetical protein [Streptacidiphilus sp. PAMC 29251]
MIWIPPFHHGWSHCLLAPDWVSWGRTALGLTKTFLTQVAQVRVGLDQVHHAAVLLGQLGA